MDNKLPKRKRNRLSQYNYAASGAYFITICTNGRRNLFWRYTPIDKEKYEGAPLPVGEDIILPQAQQIHAFSNGRQVASPTEVYGDTSLPVGEDIILPQNQARLSEYGKIVDSAIRAIPIHYPCIEVSQYVIMPNHVHLILYIPFVDGQTVYSPTSIITAVGQMKRFVSKEIGFSVWQRSFHDHIIRDKNDYDKISLYICENPIKWREDCFYTEEQERGPSLP